ncbi:sugar ABC transporter substrate-binding protein [Leifsonia sp. ZF2019]|uniref:ABC transporter substrate-binding protein n=1 Tax=Leifsonia sp. ZF2019 TaxID=2781978 RepID=UPI001CBCDEE5|nr:sugar ABC transporter substrate-binding protein [Leifsonia sp. ZF2019]UAJ79210.1 sugar ABC transporter substrate-binding protein [Leifsonia sp. ZF2019]
MPRHHHRRARLAALLTAALAVTGLAACSSEGDDRGPVTLQYGIWDPVQQPAMQKIADAYEKENPGVTVKIQVTPFSQYWTKLQTAVTGGSAPDVFWMNGPNSKLYASNGVLAPLDGVDTSKYSEGLTDIYTVDGKLYGVPKDFDTIGVWYDKALFDAAGVAYPEAGWTWDDYLATAKALTNPEAGVWGSAAALNDQQNYYDTIAQAGGSVISADGTTTGYDDPKTREGIQFWIDQITSGVSPTLEQMTDTSPEDAFLSGTIAMYWSGSWSANKYGQDPAVRDHVDVAPLPRGPEGNQSVVHGLANVANAKSPHLDAAKKFAVFASGEQAAGIQAASGAVIPAYEGTQQAWIDAYPSFRLSVFTDALDTAVPYPASINTAAWTAIQDQTLSQVWALSISPEEGLATLAKKMQAALDKEKK